MTREREAAAAAAEVCHAMRAEALAGLAERRPEFDAVYQRFIDARLVNELPARGPFSIAEASILELCVQLAAAAVFTDDLEG